MERQHLVWLLMCVLLPTSVLAKEYDVGKPLVWPGNDPHLAGAVSAYPALQSAEPETLHAFVRDNIATEVYSGVLRGARGVVLTGAGNSLDKSLLLAELLARGGHTVRVVQGQVGDDTANEIIARMETDLSGRAAGLRRAATTDLYVPNAAELPDEEEKEEIDYVASRRTATLDRIAVLWAGLRKQVARDAGIDAAQAKFNERVQRENLKRIAANHYWVQIKRGENWTDIDPILKLPAGRSAGQISARFASGEIPDRLRYSVQFHVRSTFQQSGERRTQTNLAVRGYADQLGHLPILLVHPGKGDPFSSLVNVDILLARTLGGVPFTPTLIVGGAVYAGTSLTMQGWSLENAFFGGGKPEIVDEELMMTLGSPLGETREHRRYVFNRVPASNTRSATGDWALEPLEQTSETRIVEAEETIRVDLMPEALRSVWAFRVGVGPGNADLAEKPLLREQDAAAVGDVEVLGAGAAILEAQAFVQSVARALLGDGRYTAIATGPTLSAFMVGIRSSAGNPKLDLEATPSFGLDLIDTHSLPLTGGDYVGHGLIDLAVEQTFAELLTDRLGDTGSSIFSVYNILTRAASAGIPIVTVSNAAELARVDASVRPLLAAQLGGGTLIVPREPIEFFGGKRLAWLHLDAKTGYASDGSSLEARATLVEYIQKNKSVIRITETICRFRQCLAMAKAVAAGSVKILRGQIEMRAIVDVAMEFKNASDCGKVKLTIPVYKVWKRGTSQADRDIRNKMAAMQQAARDGKLKVPSKRDYDKNRDRDAGEFGRQRERELGRKKRDDEAWDHRIELGCGGKHEPSNVFPLDKSYNSSIGNYLGRACKALCNGTIISAINFKYILKGKPGALLRDELFMLADAFAAASTFGEECRTH
ncbi:MAG TPA: hypothetical protein VJS66_01120 [Burkholderiales bacterium]|nr:hypothetical protein [Burkholderiales bacterium]